MQLFDPASPEAKGLRLLVVSVRTPNQRWHHFIQQTSLHARLARCGKIGAIMRGGVYDRLESDVLLFDRTFNSIISGGCVFLVNQREFEQGVGFTERAGEAATATFKSITAQLRIKNVDALVEAIGTDANMIAKLRGIQAKMTASKAYSEAMQMDLLVPFIRDNPQLQIDLEGVAGEEQLVFYPEPARRWRILKLLDDDYLRSLLTKLNYEANSKTVLG